MYKTIITFKNDVSNESLNSYNLLCCNAFDNRAGRAINKSKNKNRFIFEGDDALYGCLQLGVLSLYQSKDFINSVSSWEWVDEEPKESCDVLRELSIPVY